MKYYVEKIIIKLFVSITYMHKEKELSIQAIEDGGNGNYVYMYERTTPISPQ